MPTFIEIAISYNEPYTLGRAAKHVSLSSKLSRAQHLATKDVVGIIALCFTMISLVSVLKRFQRFPKEILCFLERNISVPKGT